MIASDCISEGQNLQDCDTVINYDIHWNPVRIIQRFGRIDRIGSRAQSVHLVNFWPTANLDRYINLKLRVEARMALVDLTATQTDNPLDEQQLEDLVTADLRLRDRQLERLRKEVLNLEDFEDTVTLADFSLDDFRLDLLRYLETNRDKLEQAPLGLYAVVPPAPAVPLCPPGVIFCLRHKGAPRGRPEREDQPAGAVLPRLRSRRRAGPSRLHSGQDHSEPFPRTRPRKDRALQRSLPVVRPGDRAGTVHGYLQPPADGLRGLHRRHLPPPRRRRPAERPVVRDPEPDRAGQ